MGVKKVFPKLIFSVIFSCCFLFSSCNKDCHENVAGTWKCVHQIVQELYANEDEPDSYLGNITVVETLTYSFNDDLSFQKDLMLVVEECEVSDYPEPPYDVMSLKGNSNGLTVKGTYKASQSSIALKADTIEFAGDSQVYNFAEYYTANPSIGKHQGSTKYKKNERILIINNLDTNAEDEFRKVVKN